MDKKTLPVLLVIVVLVVGAVVLVMKAPRPQPAPEPTASVEPTAIPTPATAPELEEFEEERASQGIVLVTDSGFDPATVTIVIGTQVNWVNQTNTTVNVSSAPHPAHTLYPALNLGDFAKDASVTLTFDTLGEYQYHNHLAPSQTGVINVVAEQLINGQF